MAGTSAGPTGERLYALVVSYEPTRKTALLSMPGFDACAGSSRGCVGAYPRSGREHYRRRAVHHHSLGPPPGKQLSARFGLPGEKTEFATECKVF